ncbi:MAG TPA: MBL fold metallo-hydrolase [Actinomycetota bacterium]|nr:MBL fold metallo-hydrolase [Actinomycetota bacterium]
MTHHYEGDDLIVRKIEVGDMENNVYLLEDPDTHDALLVDGCFEPDTILERCEGANIVGIVQTHGHFDHVQALASLKERLAVPVYAHPAEEYPVPIDVGVEEGDTIGFGSKVARVLHTPGHTPGGICLVVGDHLISGDTLFPGGPGNTWGDADAFASILDAIEKKLFVLDDATRVYPGHGKDTTIGAERPQLEEWRSRGW